MRRVVTGSWDAEIPIDVDVLRRFQLKTSGVARVIEYLCIYIYLIILYASTSFCRLMNWIDPQLKNGLPVQTKSLSVKIEGPRFQVFIAAAINETSETRIRFTD